MRLSKLAYYMDLYLSIALIAGMAAVTAMSGQWLQGGHWLLSVLLGFTGWTLIEYSVHRWVYHRAPYFRDLHKAHHAVPKSLIGAPPLIPIVLLFAIGFAPMPTTGYVASSGLTTGLLLGYVGYMVVHHAAHYWPMTPASPLYTICRHHALHHCHSDAGNFGITTMFWDHVLGTAVETRQRRIDPQPP